MGTRIMAIAAVLAVGVLAACGGDDEVETFIADADAICAERYANEPPVTAMPDTDPDEFRATLDEKLAVFETEHDDLAALEPPDDLDAGFEEFVALLDERNELSAEARDAAIAQEPTPDHVLDRQRQLAVEQVEQAESIGFEVCGLGRYADTDPEPQESFDDALATLEEVVADEDCERFADEVIVTTQKPIAEQICDAVVTDFKGFTANEAETEEFGTGAVLEHETENGVVLQPFVVEGDETFRMATYVYQDQAGVGVEAPAQNQNEQTVEAAIEAIEAEDCEALEPLADLESFGSLDQACATFIPRYAGSFEPAPEVTELGANAWFAFYGIRTAGNYLTAIVSLKDKNDGEEVRNSYRVSGIEPAFR